MASPGTPLLLALKILCKLLFPWLVICSPWTSLLFSSLCEVDAFHTLDVPDYSQAKDTHLSLSLPSPGLQVSISSRTASPNDPRESSDTCQRRDLPPPTPAPPDAHFTVFNDTRIHISHAGNRLWSHPKSVLLDHSCTLESPGDRTERHCPRSAMLQLRHVKNSLAKTWDLIPRGLERSHAFCSGHFVPLWSHDHQFRTYIIYS